MDRRDTLGACARIVRAMTYRVICADGSIAGEFSDRADAERQVEVLESAGERASILEV